MAKEEKKVRGVFEKVPGSGVWWIQYFDARGRRRREKAGTKSSAITLYRKRKTEALEGRKLPENLRSVVKVSDLAPAILRDYEINGKKSSSTVGFRLRKHVIPHFGSMAVDDLGTEDFNRYIDRRKKAGATNATINREIAVLKRMFHLARYSNPPKIRELPVFPARLKENPPRQGFVEDRNYELLMTHAGTLWLKAILAVAYTFGFRKRELQMRVSQVDINGGSLRLYAGTTKNDEARVIKMTAEVTDLLRVCVAGKGPEDYVFTREDGEPVRDFRGAWWALCEASGLGRFVEIRDKRGRKRMKWQGLLFHDLRRSAVRNLVRSGVLESVAMTLSGHKTRSVFERYNIVSEADIDAAAEKIEQARQRNLGARPEEPSATTSATDSNRYAQAQAMAAD